MQRIGIIGAGAWGTALAMAARRAGRDVLIQAREAETVDAINQEHRNALFLPDVELDPAIRATADLAQAADADAVLLAVPAQFLRGTCRDLASSWTEGIPAVICAKGIERGSGALMSEVVAETLPQAPIAILSGPTFAIEVARDLPTGVTLASEDTALAQSLSDALFTQRLRIYSSDDVVGTQLGGAVKNVLAIGCGIVEGRGLGDNARAALITRGLTEIIRLAAAKGAKPESLMGLSGLGDLTLTCNALQSRNFSLGVALGQGQSLDAILGQRTSVAEGVASAASVSELAGRLGVDMPICLAVNGILHQDVDIDAAIEALLARPMAAEDPFGPKA